jgi:hypothetical protein
VTGSLFAAGLTALTAVALVALAVAAFVASIRLGMLIGLRLDRALEVSAPAAGDDHVETSSPVPSSGLRNGASPNVIPGGGNGRQEVRGE